MTLTWKRIGHSRWRAIERPELTVQRHTQDAGRAGFIIRFVCRRDQEEVGRKDSLREAQLLAEGQP